MIQRLLSLKSRKNGLASTAFAGIVSITALSMSVHAAPTLTTQTEPAAGIVPALIAASNAPPSSDPH
ncbi:hypothetical protein MT378_20035, partial [Psychrobacter sp. 16-Bac2893]